MKRLLLPNLKLTGVDLQQHSQVWLKVVGSAVLRVRLVQQTWKQQYVHTKKLIWKIYFYHF